MKNPLVLAGAAALALAPSLLVNTPACRADDVWVTTDVRLAIDEETPGWEIDEPQMELVDQYVTEGAYADPGFKFRYNNNQSAGASAGASIDHMSGIPNKATKTFSVTFPVRYEGM